MGELSGPNLASLLWALVALGVKPTATWLEVYEGACRATLQGGIMLRSGDGSGWVWVCLCGAALKAHEEACGSRAMVRGGFVF